jgi:8-oxo-dGTP diphosphatase
MKKSVICHDIKGEKYEVLTEELNFRPAAYGIIIKDDKILLCRIFDGYDFPGGGIKKGENIEESLKREIYEETGITTQPDKIITATEDFFISIESKRKLHSILLYYLCKNPEGNISTDFFDNDEKKTMKEAEWIDLKDIKNIKFINGIDSIKLIENAIKLSN